MDALRRDVFIPPATKDDAQHRVDRIKAFQEELAQLEQDDVLCLSPTQKDQVSHYHAETLIILSKQFDVDTSIAAKQMSLGMRIVSFLGAVALSAAVFFFFYRFWGMLSTPAQVTILVAAPLIILAGVDIAARRERTLYFATLIAVVAFTAFVLDLSMLGQIFSITPSQNAFLAWGIFALIISYAYRLRLLLIAGLICVMGYLAATMGTWSGIYWLSFGERPENFIVTGILFFAAAFLPMESHRVFASTYRLFGLLVVLLAVLILSHWGMGSYFMFSAKHVEYLYQTVGFILSGLAIWIGIQHHWQGITNLGSTFFTVFLYTKIFDWWWDSMPKYLFFLLLGAIALGLLLILKKTRSLVREVQS